MQGCNLSAARCAGWRQPSRYNDAAAGCRGRHHCLWRQVAVGVAFWPQCAKPMPSTVSWRQGPYNGIFQPTVGGTVAALSVDCRSHCIGTVYGTVYGTVAPLSGHTVSVYSTRVEAWVGDCGGRVGRGGTLSHFVGTIRTVVLYFAQHFKTKKAGPVSVYAGEQSTGNHAPKQ